MKFEVRLFGVMCFLAASLASAWSDVITGQNPRIIDVNPGHGANVSYLILDEGSLAPEPIIFAWHYDGTMNPSTGTNWSGTDLFEGIRSSLAGSANQLSVTSQLYGTNAYSQALVTGFSFGSASSAAINPSGSLVWTYWIKGGSEYEPYGDNGTFTFDAPTGAWIISPGTSDTRWISNGSCDGWTISPFSYTGAPSDTHVYTDRLGHAQPVTFGTYTGSHPFLFLPPVLAGGPFAVLSRQEQHVRPLLPTSLYVGGPSLQVTLNSGLAPRLSSSNPKVIRVENGTLLRPVGVGKATITVAQSGSTTWYQMPPATLTITVGKAPNR